MKTSVGGDPAWGAAIGNLASLFDPKVAAEGAALQARTRNFDAGARYDTARAKAVEDQNAAYEDSVLAQAGYNPMERAAIRSARSNSVADVMRGVNFGRGREMLTSGADPRQAALLLGEGQALRPDAAFTTEGAKAIRDEEAANLLARTIAGASVRSAADPNATATLPAGSVLVRKADGSIVAEGAPATTSLAPGATLVNKNDGSVVAQGAAKPADPLKEAQSQKVINDLIISAVGGVKDKKTGAVTVERNGTLMPLDAAQLARIQARVKQMNPAPDQIDAAVQQAAAAEGIDLNNKQNVRGDWTLFNWAGPVKGVKFGETTPVTPPAPAPAASAPAPAAPAAAGEIVVQTQADIDNAPSGAILIVNGKRMRKP